MRRLLLDGVRALLCRQGLQRGQVNDQENITVNNTCHNCINHTLRLDHHNYN